MKINGIEVTGPRNKKYYTLCVRIDGSKFLPEFGDYKKKNVDAEYSDWRMDVAKRDLKIICTAPDQDSIDAAVDKLNINR